MPGQGSAIAPPTSSEPTSRPRSVKAVDAAAVFVGGSVGTLLRYGLTLSVPTPASLAVTSLGATLTVNITGSFLLAALLQYLTGRSETAVMRRSRLALGTGVISGYTTYSTLAVEVQQLLLDGHEVTALAYVAITVAGGFAAAAAGASVTHVVAGAAGGASELESEEGQP